MNVRCLNSRVFKYNTPVYEKVHEMKITFEDIGKLIAFDSDADFDSSNNQSIGTTSNVTAAGTDFKLWCDYIYLDTDERRRFAQVSHEYLITQVQHQEFATGTATMELNFNHPVKELVWTGNWNTGTFTTLTVNNTYQLKLNGHDRFADRYTQSSVTDLEEKIRQLTVDELGPALKKGELDIHEIARKVSLFTITDMIGLEREIALKARELIDIFYERDPAIMGVTPKGQEAFGQCMGLMLQLAAEWRKDTPPSPTHINAWINKQVREGVWMSDEQIMGNTSMLIITGADTVPYNIANLFYYISFYL